MPRKIPPRLRHLQPGICAGCGRVSQTAFCGICAPSPLPYERLSESDRRQNGYAFPRGSAGYFDSGNKTA